MSSIPNETQVKDYLKAFAIAIPVTIFLFIIAQVVIGLT